ncbi:MAG: hypothetical protein GY820_39210 [Gammaproteobacteria bacterium]|nr:hypothetical protein [Gammaproteobacteria bacterium]
MMIESPTKIGGYGKHYLEATIRWEYEPKEPMTDTYPGKHAEVMIQEIIVDDVDIMDELSEKCLDRLEGECWDELGIER